MLPVVVCLTLVRMRKKIEVELDQTVAHITQKTQAQALASQALLAQLTHIGLLFTGLFVTGLFAQILFTTSQGQQQKNPTY